MYQERAGSPIPGTDRRDRCLRIVHTGQRHVWTDVPASFAFDGKAQARCQGQRAIA